MSSRRHKRRRMCEGKVRHASSRGALLARRLMDCKGLSVYHCLACGGWHIGRTPAYAAGKGFIARRDSR